MKNLLYLFLIGAICWSCSKEMTADELTQYVADEDNGLKKESTMGATTVSLIFRPTDLIVSQELEWADNHFPIDSIQKKYASYYFFVLSLSRNNKEALHQTNMNEYSDLLNTLSFRMNEFVTMTTAAQDTIPVGDFMLNRTFGMSSSTDLLFVFDKTKAKDQQWVQFNLNEFGLGVGNQRFRFDVTDLENVPRVDFSEQ